jgi:hypothetical protein
MTTGSLRDAPANAAALVRSPAAARRRTHTSLERDFRALLAAEQTWRELLASTAIVLLDADDQAPQ